MTRLLMLCCWVVYIPNKIQGCGIVTKEGIPFGFEKNYLGYIKREEKI